MGSQGMWKNTEWIGRQKKSYEPEGKGFKGNSGG